MQIPISLRHRQFFIFWLGTTFGWIGNQVLVWAIPWHIRSITDNPLALGLVGLIRLIPTILFSLFSGILADTFNRKKIVFLTQALMVSISLLFAILTFTNIIKLWHIYLLLAVHATTYVVDLPARYSLTPNLVDKRNLPNALSIELLGIQIGSLIGPILSGYSINRFGQSSAYLISLSLFSMLGIALLAIGEVSQEKLIKVKSGFNWAAIQDGIKFTFHHPLIFPSMLMDFVATSLTRADSLMPFFARDVLNLNAGQYGWLSAASAIGAVIMSTTLSQFEKIRHQGIMLIGAVMSVGLGAIVFGFSRNFILSMMALLFIGASDSLSSILRSGIRQHHTTDKLRGRMTSVNQIFFMGGPYLGDVKSGFLGKLIGVPFAVSLGGFLCILSVVWITHHWPDLSNYDNPIH